MSVEVVVNKSKKRLVPLMLALYILAFLDRSNLGFAKETYQLDVGLSNEAYALGAGIFFVCYAFLGAPCNLIMRKIGARKWISFTTLVWGLLSLLMAYADSEWKFLTIRILLGAAEAGFFPGMIYFCSIWFPQNYRASITGLFYMGAPLALILGAPLSGALLELNGFIGKPGWYWMFFIEGLLAMMVGAFAYYYLDDKPQDARFLNEDEKKILISELQIEEKKTVASKMSELFKNIHIWMFCIVYLTIQMAVYGLVFFLPTQVAGIMGTTVGFWSSLVIAIPWIAALIGTYYIPRYSDKRNERKKVAAFTLLMGSIGIACSVLFSNPYIAIFALCFAAVGVIAVQPVFWTMPTRILSGAALAGGIGVINMFGAFGGFLAPILRVKMETLFNSFSAGLLFLALSGIVGVVIIMAIKQNTDK